MANKEQIAQLLDDNPVFNEALAEFVEWQSNDNYLKLVETIAAIIAEEM